MKIKTAFREKALHFPLTRIIVGILSLILTLSLTRYIIRFFTVDILPGEWVAVITAVAVAITTIMVYRFLFMKYEGRKIKELKVGNAAYLVFAGLLIGLLLQSLTIFVMHLAGSYTITGFNSMNVLLIPLAMAISSSVFEELLIRGVLFRIMEQSLGSYAALGISALIFGLLHVSNPNSNIWIGLSLAIQAGLLLGAAFMVTRSLWVPIGIHFAWNFFQSGVFGAATSGIQFQNSLLSVMIDGNKWITGGAFGPEGSVQATLFCLIAAVIMILKSKKHNNIIPFNRKNEIGLVNHA
jgi:uncharacterized protein